MGKRFGRNQRRKMMAELSKAGETMDRLSEMLDGARADRNQLRRRIEEWDQRIRCLLGEYSIFLSKPAQVQVQYLMERAPLRMQASVLQQRFEAVLSPEDVLDYVTLNLFEVLAKEDINKLARNVYFVQVN